MISDETQKGSELILKIDAQFPAGKQDPHALWKFIERRADRMTQGVDGTQVVARLKALKINYGMSIFSLYS